MSILEDFIANERIINLKEFTKDYKYNRYELKTNSVTDILNEINQIGYEEVAKKYGVSIKYLKSTFRPINKIPSGINKYVKINDKIKNEIKLLHNNGYGKIHISNIEYKNGGFINPKDIEKIIKENNIKQNIILQEPVIDIYKKEYNLDIEEDD